MSVQAAVRAAEWAGWPLGPAQLELLERFADWLIGEAVPAGGLGPNEAERMWSRHVGDSLLFAGGWPLSEPPQSVVDVGTGVGLPGIPLAILWPDSHILLTDRSGRRVDLARRAVRVLGLMNAEVVQVDAGRLRKEADLLVARAVADVDLVRQWVRHLVKPGGRAVVGGSWEERPAADPDFDVVEVPPWVLDRPVWLRIMAAA